MKKKLLLLGVPILALLLLTTGIQAPESPPTEPKQVTIEYKDANMTIEFKEDGNYIGQATLKSHTTYDEVKKVTSGKSKTVVWYEFSGFESNQLDGLKSVEFIDMRKQIVDKTDLNTEKEPKIIPNPDYLQPINKDYNFVYLKDGEWLTYNSFDIPKENIIIGVQTNLFWGEFLDVRLNVFGNEFDRHAIVIGTDAGFVEEAPVNAPGGTGHLVIDNYARVTRDTSPETATTITEMGWYCETPSQESNFEVGLYAADGDVVPGEAGTLLYSDTTNAKGTTSGWKRVTGLNWSIDADTSYWLGIQLDDVATTTYVNYHSSGGYGYDYSTPQASLPNPFGGGALSDADAIIAIYAVWEAAAATCDCPASGHWQISDGSACTLTTACTLTDGNLHISSGSLTIATGGHLFIPAGHSAIIDNDQNLVIQGGKISVFK